MCRACLGKYYGRVGRDSLPTDFIDSCLGTLELAEENDSLLAPAALAHRRAALLQNIVVQEERGMVVDAESAEMRLVEIVACSGTVCTFDF